MSVFVDAIDRVVRYRGLLEPMLKEEGCLHDPLKQDSENSRRFI